MFLVTAMAFPIRFATEHVALNYMFKIVPYENCTKYIGCVNIAHSYVGPIAFVNR